MKYKDFGLANPVELSREKVVQKLVESGVLATYQTTAF